MRTDRACGRFAGRVTNHERKGPLLAQYMGRESIPVCGVSYDRSLGGVFELWYPRNDPMDAGRKSSRGRVSAVDFPIRLVVTPITFAA